MGVIKNTAEGGIRGAWEGIKGFFGGGFKGALIGGLAVAAIAGGLAAFAVFGIPALFTGVGAALSAVGGSGAVASTVGSFLGVKGMIVAGVAALGGVVGAVYGGGFGSIFGGAKGVVKGASQPFQRDGQVRAQERAVALDRQAGIQQLAQVDTAQKAEIQARLAQRTQAAGGFDNPDAKTGFADKAAAGVDQTQGRAV